MSAATTNNKQSSVVSTRSALLYMQARYEWRDKLVPEDATSLIEQCLSSQPGDASFMKNGVINPYLSNPLQIKPRYSTTFFPRLWRAIRTMPIRYPSGTRADAIYILSFGKMIALCEAGRGNEKWR